VRRVLGRSAVLATLLAAAGILGFESYADLGDRPHPSAGWARAIALARQAERTKPVVPALQARDRAVEQLQELTRSGPAPSRSRAAMLAGLLEVRNSQFERDQQRALLGLAVAALQSAVRLDRGNDDAAYDLELLLSRSAQAGHPIAPPKNGRRKTAPGRPGRSPLSTGY
jgi:hypothetical protein